MLIDAHVHVGQHHLPIEEVSEVLRLAGVDRAVIFADPESTDIPGDQDYVLRVAGDHGHIPFFYVGGNAYSTRRPYPEVPLLENFHLYRGVKWHCWFTPSHDSGGGPLGMDARRVSEAILEPSVAAFMAAVEKLGLPVLFEEHFDVTVRFIEEYPRVRFIIPHMGLLNGGVDEVVSHFAGHPRVWFESSFYALDTTIVDRLGADRVLFGSDFPYGDPASARKAFEEADMPDEAREAIAWRNLFRLVGEDA